eukprot:GHVT01096899.1.p1 GENE.GHVT01096899.1~~GHVT01096899.1.p1  ORF type:complete len:562 (+),score=121.75 GHVT01096899.1:1074-2759(+)
MSFCFDLVQHISFWFCSHDFSRPISLLPQSPILDTGVFFFNLNTWFYVCFGVFIQFRSLQGFDMGIRIEPFNMRREKRLGRFDADGNFVWRGRARRRGAPGGGRALEAAADDEEDEEEDDVVDGWLAAVDTGDALAKFKNAEEIQRILAHRSSAPLSAPSVSASLPPPEVLRRLISLLRLCETPARALRRLRPPAATTRATAPGSWRARQQASRAAKRLLDEQSDAAKLAAEGGVSTVSSSTSRDPDEPPAGDSDNAGPPRQAPMTHKRGIQNLQEKKDEQQQQPVNKAAKIAHTTQTNQSVAPAGGTASDGKQILPATIAPFDQVTELCDTLMREGRDVYSMRREELVSMLESLEAPLVDAVGHEIAVGQAAPDDSSAAGSARMWQFYWALAGAPAQNEEAEGPALQSPQGTQDHAAAAAPAAPAAAAAPAAPAAAIVHGPVASNVILEWILQGYISAATPVKVREVPQQQSGRAPLPSNGPWVNWTEVDFGKVVQEEISRTSAWDSGIAASEALEAEAIALDAAEEAERVREAHVATLSKDDQVMERLKAGQAKNKLQE